MILQANNIEVDWDDMPYFEADDPTKADAEVLGKLANRLASSGLMTQAVHRKLLENMELPTEGIEDIDYEALRTGGGSEGSGNGATQKEGGGSDTNNENAS